MVTIRRPLSVLFSASNLPDDRLKSGCISYWAINLTSSSIKEVDFTDYYASSSRLFDYSLSAAFTAWDVDHDKVAQVLVWDFAVDGMLRLFSTDHVVRQKLEFRYGAQSVVVDNEDAIETHTPVAIGACFAGLPGTQEDICVRLLFPNKMVLYEPFGGQKQFEFRENPFWTTAPETFLPTNKDDESDETEDESHKTHFHTPLVTTIDLSRIASAHLKTVLKSYADIPPNFTYPYSAFVSTQRPVRFRVGERQRFDRRCALGFGAIESWSKMYHLFIIVLDPATRTHKILVAKAFSSSVVFGWKNMHASGAERLFKKALARVVRVGGRHDCRVDCEPLVEGVKGLVRYESWAEVVEVIEMEEEGIALAGWGVHAW